MCYFTYEVLKLCSWLCQNLALGNHLHLITLWFSVGFVSVKNCSSVCFGGRSGSSRKARGGLQAAEGEMSPDERWHEWRR